jgi:hypothetical protein
MANTKSKKELPRKAPAPPVKDLTNLYQSLAYFPTEYKQSRLWMAQALYFAKNNCQRLQEPEKAKKYRKLDEGIINEQQYKNLIDPPTSKDQGGKAEFFAADWKTIPIDAHLDNILDTEIRTIPNNITCTLADPIAKSLEQKDKERIIAQGMVRNIVNWFAKELGMPPISESVDPYKWIQNFTAKKGDKKVDEVGDVVDQIRNKIHDDDGLRLFQNYLYKNGLEVAFEIGIKYYFLDQNEFQVKYSHQFLRDLKNFNKVSGRWAIDEMTGQGTVEYIDPTELFTSPFKDRNGDDILYWFHEPIVSMAKFESLLGTDMDYEDKKKALELQKRQGFSTGVGFGNNSKDSNSQIKIGFFSILTQEANTFSEKYINDKVTTWDNNELTWEPDENVNEAKKVKAYNVWYSCYYLPQNIFSSTSNSAIDWQEESKYIFHIRKDIDMMRYGADKRYAKSSLILWKNETQQSWTDIKEAFMPKMRTLWHKFQNCIVQDVQGLALDQDLLAGMLNAVDEANTSQSKGGDKVVNEWKMLRQAGMAWLKFRDKNGDMSVQDPSKLFVPIDSGHMKKAEMYLETIMNLYNVMTQSLAKGQAGEGMQPKPRTPLGAIEIANAAASKATYFIQESYTEGVVIPFAMRCAQHIHTICRERKTYDYSKRWEQFNDVIGRYNGAVLEGIEDINFENIGLTISNEDDNNKRELVIQQIIQKYAQKGITTAGLGLALGTDNWKLQLVELALEEGKADEKAAAIAQQQHQEQMEQMQMQLQIAQALEGAKSQGRNSNIQTQGQTDAQIAQLTAQLKEKGMELQKQILLNNKLTENQQKSELSKDKATHESNLEQAKSLAG